MMKFTFETNGLSNWNCIFLYFYFIDQYGVWLKFLYSKDIVYFIHKNAVNFNVKKCIWFPSFVWPHYSINQAKTQHRCYMESRLIKPPPVFIKNFYWLNTFQTLSQVAWHCCLWPIQSHSFYGSLGFAPIMSCMHRAAHWDKDGLWSSVNL